MNYRRCASSLVYDEMKDQLQLVGDWGKRVCVRAQWLHMQPPPARASAPTVTPTHKLSKNSRRKVLSNYQSAGGNIFKAASSLHHHPGCRHGLLRCDCYVVGTIRRRHWRHRRRRQHQLITSLSCHFFVYCWQVTSPRQVGSDCLWSHCTHRVTFADKKFDLCKNAEMLYTHKATRDFFETK